MDGQDRQDFLGVWIPTFVGMTVGRIREGGQPVGAAPLFTL